MTETLVYPFEDIPPDLPRPPFAAMRALLQAGIVVSPKGWGALSTEGRWQLVRMGARAEINLVEVQGLLRVAPVAELRLVPCTRDPKIDEIPTNLARSFGPEIRFSVEKWRALRPLDRYVLSALATNQRLLLRAVQAILPEISEGDPTSRGWRAPVAHVELVLHPGAFAMLKSPKLHDGRALMLARVAGVRAARRAQEVFDVAWETPVGTIELDCGAGDDPGVLLWQAHVSAWDGAFHPLGALHAATTAAVALCNLVAEFDPDVRIREARILEERWLVGGELLTDGATAIYADARELRAAVANASLDQDSDDREPATRIASPRAAALQGGSATSRDFAGLDASATVMNQPTPAPAPSKPVLNRTMPLGGMGPGFQPLPNRGPDPGVLGSPRASTAHPHPAPPDSGRRVDREVAEGRRAPAPARSPSRPELAPPKEAVPAGATTQRHGSRGLVVGLAVVGSAFLVALIAALILLLVRH